MADYAAWPEKRIAVATLLLDHGNPRIPFSSPSASQLELIAELVAHDDVYELAKDIAINGYIPTELLIVFDDGGKTRVLEGNRRLAALKLLSNPGLAPESQKRKFQKLANTQPSSDRVKKVGVLVAPSRVAAAPIILRKHTRDQILRWGPLMQAKFYRNLANSGVSVAILAKNYGISPSTVRDFLRTDAMYEIACSLDLTPEVAAVVRDPRAFPASVLERFLDMPKARDFLALSVDAQGDISSTAKPDDFRKAYARVVTDIATGEVDTRTINTAELAERYVAGLSAVTPRKQERSYSAVALRGGAPGMSSSRTATASGAKAPVSRRSAALVPSGLRCTLKDHRTREIFDELKKLKADRFPNAHGILLRILLEMGLSNYMTKTGAMKTLLATFQGKGKPRDWAPSLKQMINASLNDPSLDIQPAARKTLSRLVSQSQSLLSVETLDGFVHNPYILPDERNLRALWGALEDVFKVVLHEPTKNAGKHGAQSPQLKS